MLRRHKLALTLSLTLLLSACGSGPAPAESTSSSSMPTPSATPFPTATPVPTPALPENPLTGLPMETGDPGKRPIAIMLNNLKQALPQLGISQADIIYECPVEGGITRMMAVYQSVENIGSIGSVRSARPYYLELALGLDAIYLHAGGSPDAYNKINQWGVTALDCVNGPYEGTLFWRDQWRKKNMGFEHSVLTSGETITQLFPTFSFRQEHPEDYSYDMKFAPALTPVGEDALNITVPFSYYKTGLFTYDEHTSKYLVSEYGKPYVDGNSGAQVSVTNLFILKTSSAPIPGDELGRMRVELEGGQGWYAYGGKYIPIQWEKEAPSGQLRYLNADGSPLTLCQGNSYVCIVPRNSNVTFT